MDQVVFSLRVKFYPADPIRLAGNGKSMIYQQIKRDLIHGRLYCSAGEAVALGALIVQGLRQYLELCRTTFFFSLLSYYIIPVICYCTENGITVHWSLKKLFGFQKIELV